MSLLTHPAQAGQLNRYCAWALLVLSVLTLVWSMCQLAGAMMLEAWDARAWLAGHNVVASGLLGWLLSHAVSLSWLQLLSCFPCLAIAAGMLRMRNWARQGFIALLLITAVLNLAVLPLMDRLLMDMIQMISSHADALDVADSYAEAYEQLRHTRIMIWLSSLLPLLALSGIHVWLAMRYRKADMRTLFN